MDIYLSFDGDGIGRKIGQARLSDDVEQISRISNSIDAGNEVFESYAIHHGGSVIESGGDEGLISMPATALEDLESVRHTYNSAVGATVSVGVGRKVSEASKALLIAKLRGRNKVVVYEPEMDAEIEEARTDDKTEKAKIVEEYLSKAETPIDVKEGPHKTGFLPHHGVELKIQDIQEPVIPQPQQPPLSSVVENEFRNLADSKEKKDASESEQTADRVNGVKGKIANALAALKQHLPAIQEVKKIDPDAYASVVNVVGGLIELGREVSNNTMKKSDIISGGLADDKVPSEFNSEALAIGTQIELEHTKDPSVAREIAMDHLAEDPDYYVNFNKGMLEQSSKEELNPQGAPPSDNVLDKNLGKTAMIPNKKSLIPGLAISSSHLVVTSPNGKSVVRDLSSGMKRDNNQIPNPVGPGMGNPVAAKVNIPGLAKETMDDNARRKKHKGVGKDPNAVALGRLGGKKGGPARVAATSHGEREQIAEMGARARWGKS
jgi:hypothetical protein